VAQRVRGRTRHVLVDVMGFVLAVCVHAADVQDRAGARPSGEATALTSLQRLWADQGYTGAFAGWLHETRGWQLEVVRPADRQLVRYGLAARPARAFRVLPRRWIVERTFGPGRRGG
jgi:putative transposase